MEAQDEYRENIVESIIENTRDAASRVEYLGDDKRGLCFRIVPDSPADTMKLAWAIQDAMPNGFAADPVIEESVDGTFTLYVHPD